MKKLFALALFAVVALCASAATSIFGIDIRSPVTLISDMSFVSPGYRMDIVSPDGTTTTAATIGGWHYTSKYYPDVEDAVNAAPSIYNRLMNLVLNPPHYGEEGPIATADVLNGMREALSLNQIALNFAMQVKQNKILDAISNASNERDDEAGANLLKEFGQLSSKVGELSSSISTLTGVDSSLKSRLSQVERAANDNAMEIISLRKKIETQTPSIPQSEIERIRGQIADLYTSIASYKEQSGLLTLAIKNLQEMRQLMQTPVSVVSIPPETGTYSNQLVRLSKYLGNADATQGVLELPAPELESEDFTDSESGVGREGGKTGGKRIHKIMRYLWEKGFVPHLPKEAYGELLDESEAMWADRYFWDEEDSSGNIVTHAVGLTIPVEWKAFDTAWKYDASNGYWRNAHVQFGNSMDEGSGSYAASYGTNWVKCTLSTKTISVVNQKNESGNDDENDTRYFYVGNIDQDGNLVDGVFYTPIIFMWE